MGTNAHSLRALKCHLRQAGRQADMRGEQHRPHSTAPSFPGLAAVRTLPMARRPRSKKKSTPSMRKRKPRPVRPTPISAGARRGPGARSATVGGGSGHRRQWPCLAAAAEQVQHVAALARNGGAYSLPARQARARPIAARQRIGDGSRVCCRALRLSSSMVAALLLYVECTVCCLRSEQAQRATGWQLGR